MKFEIIGKSSIYNGATHAVYLWPFTFVILFAFNIVDDRFFPKNRQNSMFHSFGKYKG